jgi:L-ornithine Nalpha-acyltransferase
MGNEQAMPFGLKRGLIRRRPWSKVRPPRSRRFGMAKPFPFVRALRRGVPPTRIGELRMIAGPLEVRLAKNDAEVAAAQRLRYEVFYEELKAKASPEAAEARRDFDRFDPFCDHLIVIDHKGEGAGRIVGVYRLMRRDVAAEAGQFYTQDEFNIRKLLRGGRQILELGRSCVHPDYRSAGVMNLMWRALAHYVTMHDIKILFGCASFPGADPKAHALALSYLHHYHLAPPQMRPKALRKRYVRMDRMSPDKIDAKAAQHALPPLLRGYLRLGGVIGDGAVIDEAFDTVDVCIVVRTDRLAEDYARRYMNVRKKAGIDPVGTPLQG